MDFRNINFGKADAKTEGSECPDLLINGYLDSSGVIDLALRKSTFLFLGYKGSGKTALAEHIRLTSSNYSSFVTDIQLIDFPYKSFSRIISGSSETEAKLPLAWEWLLLIMAIESLSKDNSLSVGELDEWSDTLRTLRHIGILPFKSIRDIVNKSSKKAFRISVLSSFEFSYEEGGSMPQDSFAYIVGFLKDILRNVETHNKHYIVIDGLDEILTSRDIQYQSIAALISQTKELNVFFRNNCIPVKIIVLCRTDIFERLPHPNKNKIRQDSAYTFTWFDESSVADYSKSDLIQLANLRGQLVFPGAKDIFTEFFPKRCENQQVPQFLLEHTRHTPRDFMQLLKKIQKYCTEEKVTQINIEQGIKNYSIDYFLPEIKDELVGYLEPSKIDKFFNLLSALRKRDFSMMDVRTVIMQNPIYKELDIDVIFPVLFECSAIGHVIMADSEKRLLYFKYRNRNLSFNPNERIILHKGLWKALTV